MSHYRNLGGGKRDSNEPQIMKRFKRHGWHAEQISGNRLWDLTVFPPENKRSWFMGMCTSGLVDVKQPDGEVTKAQKEKWTALHAIGIPVYVVRTEVDVDALVSGTLAPWEPPLTKAQIKNGVAMIEKTRATMPRKNDAAKPGGMSVPRNGRDAKKACGCLRSLGRCEHSGNYAPPRSTPMDAAKEAEATFAPPPFQHHSRCTYEGGGLCSCPAGWKG